MNGRKPDEFKTLVDDGFARVAEVGKGVYAVFSDPSKGPVTISNGGFVIGSESILLIEGFGSRAGAEWVVNAARSVSQLPIKAAVLTHNHWDHSLGLVYYGGQGIDIFSHPEARELIYRHTLIQEMDRTTFLKPYQRLVDEAWDDLRRQRTGMMLGLETMHRELTDNTVHALPNKPIDLENLPMTIDLGGMVAIIEAHPGHAPDNLVVRVPDQNIAFTGDLVCHGVIPICLELNYTDLKRELDILASWGPSMLFIPGHGTPCGQQGILDLMEIMEDLKGHARRMHKQKASPEEATNSYQIPEKFNNWMSVSWDFSVGEAIKIFYAGFEGG